MKKLVTISREYGSGGRIIGAILAEKLGVPMYDKEIIDMAVEQSGLSREIIETAELRARNNFSYTLSSTFSFSEGIGAETMSMNDKLFLTQFDVIAQIGNLGEGVIVGRCADYVLRDLKDVTNVFVHAGMDDRIERCINVYGDERDKVKEKIKSYDKARRNYYNYHTSQKWGDYSNYDIALNTSYIDEETAAELIAGYISKRSGKH
jgi:cytidylate kinase